MALRANKAGYQPTVPSITMTTTSPVSAKPQTIFLRFSTLIGCQSSGKTKRKLSFFACDAFPMCFGFYVEVVDLSLTKISLSF